MTQQEILKIPTTVRAAEKFAAAIRAAAEPAMRHIDSIYARALKKTALTNIVIPAHDAWKENSNVLDWMDRSLTAMRAGTVNADIMLARFEYLNIYHQLAENNKIILAAVPTVTKYYAAVQATETAEIKHETAEFEKYYRRCSRTRQKITILLAAARYPEAAKLCLRCPPYSEGKLFTGPVGAEKPLCRQYETVTRKYQAQQAWLAKIQTKVIPRAAWLTAQIELNKIDLFHMRDQMAVAYRKLNDQALTNEALRAGMKNYPPWNNKLNHFLTELENRGTEVTGLLKSINAAEVELKEISSLTHEK